MGGGKERTPPWLLIARGREVTGGEVIATDEDETTWCWSFTTLHEHGRQLLLLDHQREVTARRLNTVTRVVVAQEAGCGQGKLAAFKFVEKIAVDMGAARLPALPYRDSCF